MLGTQQVLRPHVIHVQGSCRTEERNGLKLSHQGLVGKNSAQQPRSSVDRRAYRWTTYPRTEPCDERRCARNSGKNEEDSANRRILCDLSCNAIGRLNHCATTRAQVSSSNISTRELHVALISTVTHKKLHSTNRKNHSRPLRHQDMLHRVPYETGGSAFLKGPWRDIIPGCRPLDTLPVLSNSSSHHECHNRRRSFVASTFLHQDPSGAHAASVVAPHQNASRGLNRRKVRGIQLQGPCRAHQNHLCRP